MPRFLTLLQPFLGARSSTSATVPFDGIPWDFPAARQILAIGDLHGDLTALAALLEFARFVDAEGHWTGEESHLVLLGDIWAGHRDSVVLIDFILRLETQAKQAGGAVHVLLGNHDLLPVQGSLRGFTPKEKKGFQRLARRKGYGKEVRNYFRGNHRHAKWVRGRNTVVRIGDTLFVHAGLGVWAKTEELRRVNATVRAWLSHWQGVSPRPPKSTRWAVGKRKMKRGSKWEEGPLWNRSYRVAIGKKGQSFPDPIHSPCSPEELAEVLAQYNAKRLVVGHAPVAQGQVLLSHPMYGERVVMVDTRLSESSDRLGALLLDRQGPRSLVVLGRGAGKEIRDRLVQDFEMSLKQPPFWKGLNGAVRRWWKG